MSNISIGSDYAGGAFVWKAFPTTDANEEDTNPVVTFCGVRTQGSTRGYNTEVCFCEAGVDINTILGSNYAITIGQPLPDTTNSI